MNGTAPASRTSGCVLGLIVSAVRENVESQPVAGGQSRSIVRSPTSLQIGMEIEGRGISGDPGGQSNTRPASSPLAGPTRRQKALVVA